MATESISQLPAATVANLSDELPVTQGSTGPGSGTTRRETVQQIGTALGLGASGVAGSMATENANAVAITGGTISGADESGDLVTATGGSAARTNADRWGDLPTLKDLGAKGDGTTNDLGAFQTAQTLGRAVRITAGTYKIGAGFTSITVPLIFEPGAMLDLSAANFAPKCIVAGRWQIFVNAPAGQPSLFSSTATDLCFPEWWGAKADGTTDCTTALQNALACGLRAIKLTAGAYRTTATLTTPQHDIAIHGVSQYDTTIQLDDPTGLLDVINFTTYGLKFFHLTLARKQAATAGAIVHQQSGSYELTFENCTIGGSTAWNGVQREAGAGRIFVRRSTIDHCLNDAISMPGTDAAKITDLWVEESNLRYSGRAAIEATGWIDGVFVDNNEIYGNKYAFIFDQAGYTHAAGSMKFRDNDIDTNAGDATYGSAYFKGAGATIFEGNWYSNNGYPMTFVDCGGWSIRDGNIQGVTNSPNLMVFKGSSSIDLSCYMSPASNNTALILLAPDSAGKNCSGFSVGPMTVQAGVATTLVSAAAPTSGTHDEIAIKGAQVSGVGGLTYLDSPGYCTHLVYPANRRYGTTAQRPTGLGANGTGDEYFDATLAKPVWWDGAAWRDATGTAA